MDRITTIKQVHGEDAFAKWGRKGGKKKGQGYFGWLKKHDPEALRQLSLNREAKKKRLDT